MPIYPDTSQMANRLQAGRGAGGPPTPPPRPGPAVPAPPMAPPPQNGPAEVIGQVKILLAKAMEMLSALGGGGV